MLQMPERGVCSPNLLSMIISCVPVREKVHFNLRRRLANKSGESLTQLTILPADSVPLEYDRMTRQIDACDDFILLIILDYSFKRLYDP